MLQPRSDKPRTYIRVNELNETGLLNRLLSPAMRNILFSIMPDPVLYHCIISEIAGNDTRSHVAAHRMNGWHCDSDSVLLRDEVTHVSIFTYLTDVGPQDGAFEISPKYPSWMNSNDPSILVTGRTGFTFAWQRSYFHRASPNRGPRRRRIFKLSFQRNRFPSHYLNAPDFRATIAATPPGNLEMDILLGRYQGSEAPAVTGIVAPTQSALQPTGVVGVPNAELLSGQLRFRVGSARDSLKSLVLGRQPQLSEGY